MTEPALVAIYADESCLGNGREGSNPGGAGGVIEWIHPITGELKRWDYWISEPHTTNNRMAFRSVIEAFRELGKRNRPFRVVFTSDSKYIVEGMSAWVPGWIARGWRRKGGPIENLELWREAVDAVNSSSNASGNGFADMSVSRRTSTRIISRRARQRNKPIPADWLSEFESWLEAQQLKQALTETAPFPDSGTFKPSPRAWTT